MPLNAYCAAIAVLVCSCVLTWWVRRFAIRHRMIDTPNARSSHSTPVPRGGGLAMVIASAVGIAVLQLADIVDRKLALALLGGGLAVAWIGFKDDRGSVSAGLRLCVHGMAAIWAMYMLGGLPAIQFGAHIVDLGVAGDVLGTLAVAWTLNLFNFMDGIDGIAASEATFVTASGAILCLASGASASVPAAALVMAAASAGFLIWNWPRARIFMGDVGSGYLGFVIAVLALASGREVPVAPLLWLILGAVFFADSFTTLLRRLIRGERVYEAHSTHAYQILARRWRSHAAVTLTVIAVDLFVLLPLAWMANTFVAWAGFVTLAVLVALAAMVFAIGRERPV